MTERLESRPIPPRSIDLTVLDWHVPVQVERLPVKDARHPRLWARPDGLELLAAFHGSARSAAALVPDLALVALAAFLVGSGEPWRRGLYVLAVLVACVASGVYRDRDSVQSRGVTWHVRATVPPLCVVAGAGVAAGAFSPGRAAALAAATAALLAAGRVLSWTVLVGARRRGAGLRPTLLLGSPDDIDVVWRRLVEFPEAGLAPVEQLSYAAVDVPGALAHELDRWAFEHVVLVSPGADAAGLSARLPRHSTGAPFFSVVPSLTDLFVSPRFADEVGGIPLHALGRPTLDRRRFAGKRAMDLVLGGLLLLCAAPLFAAIAAAIKLGDRGPVFYRQARVGRDGVPFQVVKFRTMVVGADRMQESLAGQNVADGLLFKLRSDPRVTRVGAFLRRTSLDELPQLCNVLRGEMSLVGPRPLAVQPEQFSAPDDRRHAVCPGITGYWQVSGGNELTFAEMVRLDLAYIRDWSLWLDIRLLLRTLPAVVHRHGAV